MTARRRSSSLALAFLGLATLLAASACTTAPPAATFEVPDAIVLISLDTLRADYLNTYGYTRFATTPFLDRFAAENALFERAYITEPWTLTSHMSLLTGLHWRHGVRVGAPLAPGIPTLAARLKAHGYRTQAFVDGGWVKPSWGFDRGFDGFGVHENAGLARIRPDAEAWLEQHRAERFFLFLHTYDVHSAGPIPLYVSPEPIGGSFSGANQPGLCQETFQRIPRENLTKGFSAEEIECIRAAYAEGVRYVDSQLEELFTFLKKIGRYDRTLIVVWSDHGDGLFDHEDWSHGEVFEHTIHVPFVMKIPGQATGGRRFRTMTSSPDIMPTILELAGAPVPPGLDGTSLLPLFRDDPGGGLALSKRVKEPTRVYSVRGPRYHYVRDAVRDRTYFFDLERDPREAKNLHPSTLPEEKDMAGRVTAWIEEMAAAEQVKVPVPQLTLDRATEERLKALGYLGDKQ